jgi:hypothetical protein
LLGLPREHADRAAGAVTAEERALRAAQHLDALNVDQAHDGARRARHEDVVDVVADAALAGGAAAAADAPNLERRRRVTRAARALDVEVRRDRRELEHVFDAAQLERVAVEAHDGDRRVLEIQLAALRRDDDLLELLRFDRVSRSERGADRGRQRGCALNGQLECCSHESP